MEYYSAIKKKRERTNYWYTPHLAGSQGDYAEGEKKQISKDDTLNDSVYIVFFKLQR